MTPLGITRCGNVPLSSSSRRPLFSSSSVLLHLLSVSNGQPLDKHVKGPFGLCFECLGHCPWHTLIYECWSFHDHRVSLVVEWRECRRAVRWCWLELAGPLFIECTDNISVLIMSRMMWQQWPLSSTRCTLRWSGNGRVPSSSSRVSSSCVLVVRSSALMMFIRHLDGLHFAILQSESISIVDWSKDQEFSEFL